jgi:transcriptional regulator with XRE-family HTH domain
VDDQRLGGLVRVLRIRRGLRQVDVALLAGVSDQTVSRIERGHIESLSVSALRRVARVLEARLELTIRSRSGDIERFGSAAHSALVETVITALREAGWTARPEVSFSVAGERGLIDIVAWHAPTRSLLLIEIKTEVVDVGEAIGTFDRKRRLAAVIARQLGFDPSSVSAALVIADTHTNHRRVQEHAATFGGTLQHSGQRLRAFVARPAGSIEALAFWPIRHPGSVRPLVCGIRRVRRRSTPRGPAIPRSSRRAESSPEPAEVARRTDPEA